MGSLPNRPWYRLHWLTWVLALLVTGAVVVAEYEQHVGSIACGSGAYTATAYFGWPQAHMEVVEQGSLVGLGIQVPRSFESRWRWSCVGFNILIGVAVVVSTIWFLESWLRSPNRLQFNLRALLAFTGVVAVMLWLLVNSHWLLQTDDTPLRWVHSPLVSWHDFERPLRWPVLLGIACAIHSLGWLVVALFRRACTFVAAR